MGFSFLLFMILLCRWQEFNYEYYSLISPCVDGSYASLSQLLALGVVSHRKGFFSLCLKLSGSLFSAMFAIKHHSFFSRENIKLHWTFMTRRYSIKSSKKNFRPYLIDTYTTYMSK